MYCSLCSLNDRGTVDYSTAPANWASKVNEQGKVINTYIDKWLQSPS